MLSKIPFLLNLSAVFRQAENMSKNTATCGIQGEKIPGGNGNNSVIIAVAIVSKVACIFHELSFELMAQH